MSGVQFPRMKMKLRTKVLSDEEELILRLRNDERMLQREIAKGLQLSVQRVRQIEREARRRLEEHEASPRGGWMMLPGRVRKLLENLEFASRSEVMEAVQSGRLYYDEKAAWESGLTLAERKESGINVAKLRNAGRKSWVILMEWLGMPAPDFSAREPSRQTPPGGEVRTRGREGCFFSRPG